MKQNEKTKKFNVEKRKYIMTSELRKIIALLFDISV